MKKYFKHFSVLFIVVGVLLVIFIGVSISIGALSGYVRTNAGEEERVFDYADKLTDEEEDALRELIAEKEVLIGCDIVLVTISDPALASDYAMMNYADDFYDDRRYGFNAPWGDGALYLDNWLDDGSYCWLSTSGRVESRYSSQAINSLINEVCRTVNDDPYGAYRTYVESLSRKMQGTYGTIPMLYILGAAFIITLIYVVVGVVNNKGKKTTTANTYVAGGQPMFRDRRDIFLTKNTTRRHIDRSSGGGGGGGGHHISSGGHSHGGGGGRH